MTKLDTAPLQAAVQKATTLYSIFDRVVLGKHTFSQHRRSELPQVVLTSNGLANKAGFPILTEKALQHDLQLLEQNLHPNAQADTLPYLFQKYGWHIADPKDKDSNPDAAFCDTFRAERALDKPGPDGGYLLVKGDLTGIQEFIYNGIQPQRAGGLANLAKRLRARSILVSLLTDFIANVILRELKLNSWHLLFAGGGHFNLLLPDDEETKVRLTISAERLDKIMKERFGESLELIIAHVKVKSKEDIMLNPSRLFEEVNTERDRKKYCQHRKDLHDLFKHKVAEDKGAREKRENKIGGAFPKQDYLLEIFSERQLNFLSDYLVLAEFELQPNHYHTLIGVESPEESERFLMKNKAVSGAKENILSAHIIHLNDTEFLPNDDWKSDFNFPVSFGFRFLGKNAPVRLNENGKLEIMDFESLAKIGQESMKKGEGFLRLGALMLDVDNLGHIFSHGLQDATLARVITLSREMNYFFTAHFDQRAKEHQIYVVYSGGDDAFAVGKWDMLIRFSKVLHEDFQKFICYEQNRNDDVHFSAGLFMSNPFYPIGRFYRDAKSLQEKAKDEPGKNSVDVFNHTIQWESFGDKIRLGDLFYEVLEKGKTESGRKFSASFAYRIMQLVKTSYYERDEWQNDTFCKRGGLRPDNFARNVANMRYLFARNGFSEADIQKLTNDLEKELTRSFLTEAFNFDSKFNARDYLVALNFAMLQLRSKIQKNTAHGQPA